MERGGTATHRSPRASYRFALGAALIVLSTGVAVPAAGAADLNATPLDTGVLDAGAPDSVTPGTGPATGLIVTLDDPSTRATIVARTAAERAGVEIDSARRLGGSATFVLGLDAPLTGDDLTEAITALADEPGIATVSVDRRLRRATTPNDPDYVPYQWALKGSPPASPYYSANVAPAWDITTGSPSVVVAVLDTGYTDHPDLDPARLLPGYDFISDADFANDLDGRDGDPHDPGDWVTYTESNTASGPYEDCFVEKSSWHGTHVAGIIAATSNNNLGVAGVDWAARILPVRVLGKCGGLTSDIVDAMRWSVGLPVSGVPNNPNPARILNMSLGGGSGSCSPALQSAVNDVLAAGAAVITAAGNGGTSASNVEPGNCVGVINVTSTRTDGYRSGYGNYGSAVTIAAPGGSDSCATGIRSLYNSGDQSPVSASYKCLQGTSMATPFVSSALSLMLSVGPSLTTAQIRSLLISSARPFPNPGSNSCVAVGCGAGILDVHAAVVAAGAFITPDAPTSLVALPSPGTVSLAWSPPPDPADFPVVDFVVQRSSNGGSSWATVVDGISTVPSLAVGGLRNGTNYVFRVAAVNAIGRGPWSAPASARPAARPSPPRAARTRPLPESVRLTWTRPLASGGAPITDYFIQRSTDGLLWDDVDDGVSTSTTYTVPGLTNGVRYRFRIAAVNTSGPGSWSAIRSATPRTVPAAPIPLTGTAGNRRATLTWVLPADNGGSAVRRYLLQRSSNGGVSWSTLYTGTSLRTTYSLRTLTNGRTYWFRVAAVNAAGRGPWSDTVQVRPRTTPGAPRNLALIPGDASVTVRWDAPATSGGAPVTGYRISWSTDGLEWTPPVTVDGALREYVATGLTNGLSVRFRVAAVNEAGVGPNTAARSTTPIAPAP